MIQNSENKFASLKDHEEESIEYPNESTRSNIPSKSRVHFGVKDTQDLLNGTKDIQALLDVVINNFQFPKKIDYCKNFWDCNLSSEEYSNIMTERLHCFNDQEENSLVTRINGALDTLDSIESHSIKLLLEKTIENLSHSANNNIGQAGLFLLGLLFVHRPDLITPENISFDFSKRKQYAPIVAWLIQKAIYSGNISHLDPLLSTQLLDIFIDHASDPAIALCSAHLLSQAFKNQDVWRVSSQHYCKLLAVAKSTSYQIDSEKFLKIESIQNVERQIKEIINEILPKLVVSDKKDLANQLMSTFPDAPDFSCELFIKECAIPGNATFLDGWAETHLNPEKRSISKKYLAKIAPNIEEAHLHQFPVKDLLDSGEITELIVKKWELGNSSFRLIFLIGLIIIIYLLHNRYQLF